MKQKYFNSMDKTNEIYNPSPSIPVKEGQKVMEGLKFKSKYFKMDAQIITVHPDQNTIEVKLIPKDGSECIENWDLQHTIWGFDRGDYYIVSPLPVKEGEILDITEGEWIIEEAANQFNKWQLLIDKYSNTICEFPCYNLDGKEIPIVLNNANLISQAPAMYRALLPFKLLAQEVLDVLTKDQTVYEYNGAKITTQDLKNVLTVLFKATTNK